MRMGAGAEVVQNLESHCQVPRFVVVDLVEDLGAERILHLVEKELEQCSVERSLQGWDRRSDHRQREGLGVSVDPLDDQSNILVRHRDFPPFLEHPPTAA